MSVSVVVATRDRPTDLRDCLGSLARQTEPPAEVLVIDASSSSCARVAESFDGQLPVRYYHRPGLTPPQARNVGLERASHDLLLFIDDDAVAEARWVDDMIKLSRRHPEATLVSGHLVHVPAGSPYSILVEALRAHRYALAGTDAVIYPNLPNCLIRRDKLREQRIRFDERMVREEDIDLALQIRASGGQIVLASEATVFHRVRPTLRAFMKQRFQNAGNRARLCAKWSGPALHHYGARRSGYLALYTQLMRVSRQTGGPIRALQLTVLIAASVFAYEAGNLYYGVRSGWSGAQRSGL